jgi:hypothetical protein
MRGLLTTAIVAAALAAPRPAGAQCGKPWDALVTPHDGAPAPRNAHVWVRQPFAPGDPAWTFSLRAAPSRGKPAGGIALATRAAVAGAYRDVELTPAGRLDAGTRYEVVMSGPASRLADAIVGTFVTGDADDTTPPVWAGAKRVFPTHLLGASPPGTIRIYAECEGPGLGIDAPPATDDGATADELRYEVWYSDARGKLDYAAAPAAVIAGAWDELPGGAPSVFRLEIGGAEEGISDMPPRAFFKRRARARVGVRAVDLAGNASAPSEAEFAVPAEWR